MKNHTCIICDCKPTKNNRLAYKIINGNLSGDKNNVGYEAGMVCKKCRTVNQEVGDILRFDLSIIRKNLGKYVFQIGEKPFSIKIIEMVNNLTPNIQGKAFDPDWFLLRQELERVDESVNQHAALVAVAEAVKNSPAPQDANVAFALFALSAIRKEGK